MTYFTKDTISFLVGLAKNNSTTWFNNNKQIFQVKVKVPFQNFVGDLREELEEIENSPMAPIKDCIFRINRDVRFSKDKSPYKTFVSALISPFGRKNRAYPGFYIQISAKEVRLYGGCHDLTPDQLKSVRQSIYDQPQRFKKITSSSEFTTVFGEIKGPRNKKIPLPFTELIDDIPHIANKEFYFFTEIPIESILQAKFKSAVLRKYSACRDINLFLREGLNI